MTAERKQPSVLLLTSCMLTDRMLLHSAWLRTLAAAARVRVWAMSADHPRFARAWRAVPAEVMPFPDVQPFPEFPHNYLRRLNEFAWDFRLRPPSRLSADRHIRRERQKTRVRVLRGPAWVVSALGLEQALEDALERLLLSFRRSPEAETLFRDDPPSLLVTTSPFRFHEPAIVAVAKRMRIPVVALITSWDNLTTKNRPVFKYDGYLVWSEQMRKELVTHYPHARRVPVCVTGAPQYDVFFDPGLKLTREEFCHAQGLDPGKKIVLYALGSPNLIRELPGAIDFAHRVVRGDLGDVQLIVRPHPQFDDGSAKKSLAGLAPRVIVQRTGEPELEVNRRSQDQEQVLEWVNTFHHADVVINLSSSVTVDAAICGKPIVNLDYDPEPGSPNASLVHDINHLWSHFRPIAESGGVWLVKSLDDMVAAVRAYLGDPTRHARERRWIAEYVCGFIDGHCGERIALATIELLGSALASRANVQ